MRDHPLARRAKLQTIRNVLHWQLLSRRSAEPIPMSWVGGSTLVATRGMTGATGNLYFGLHEFHDMAFVLHLLRPGDLFVDVGANVGSYTVLASAVAGARSVSFEPGDRAAEHFLQNVRANDIASLVELRKVAIGEAPGQVRFSVGFDTTNRVVTEADGQRSATIDMSTLDIELAGLDPILMKIDVEGHEDGVVAGAAAVLATPVLRAIEVETVTPELQAMLAAQDFAEYVYDPFTRALTAASNVATASDGSHGSHGAHNRLFVRDVDFVRLRLRQAPPFTSMGQTI